MSSFIFPEKIKPTGAIAGALVTAMVKTPRAKTHVVLYNPDKPDNSAFSVHSVEINEQSLCDGEYSLNFTDAMIRLAQRAANKSNILLVD